jgi:uncharacterized protein YjbI with pentapeptide repeats
MKLKGTKFVNCKIIECDFVDSDLSNADFSFSDLSGSSFNKTNLSFANFCNSKNYLINPNENFFHKTKFSLPEAVSLLGAFDIEIV